MKSEPRSPSSFHPHQQHQQERDWGGEEEEEELNTMLASSKFAPLAQLYRSVSGGLPRLLLAEKQCEKIEGS